MTPPYSILISADTLGAIKQYKADLETGAVKPGARMKQAFRAGITTQDFIEALLSTKQPRIFAESEIRADGTDWTHRELALLGDINVAMQAQIFDNGTWNPRDAAFKAHSPPLTGELLFTPGALLNTGPDFQGTSPDYAEIVVNGRIDQAKYDALVERRLLPLLVHANEMAKQDGKPAFVMVPGIGAGVFAGPFQGTMGAHLDTALQHMLDKHGSKLDHIGVVYFDPFAEGKNLHRIIHGVDYRVRPATKNPGRPQLSDPTVFEEAGDDFSNYKLYKLVAWDHASLPGNDFFANARQTDDGVSAAATNSMETVTGIKGNYKNGKYLPPAGYASWEDVALQNNVGLSAATVKVVAQDGSYLDLSAYEKPAAPKRSAGPRP